MFEMLVKLILWLIGQLSNLIIMPIISLLELSLPGLSEYIISIETYLDQYLWPTAALVKRIMINFGMPQIIFTFFISWYTFRIAMATGVRVYALIDNLYKKFKP